MAVAWHVPSETVRRMDKRVLRRWAVARPRKPVRALGVDELHLGRRDKFPTVVSDLESGEPLWAGRDRKRETLDRFFAEGLPSARRRAVRAEKTEGASDALKAPVCAITEKTFGQRRRSEPVTGEALGAWRAAWGRAAGSA